MFTIIVFLLSKLDCNWRLAKLLILFFQFRFSGVSQLFIKSLRILFIQLPADFKKFFLRHAADFRFRDDLLQQFL